MTYAAQTTVSSEKSKAEIERILRRYGCSKFAYGWDDQGAMIVFTVDNRQIRFVLPLPNPRDKQFTHHSRGKRTDKAAQEAYEQGVRARWRALALIIKAKLEAVESGILSFEDEFGMFYALPDGSTVRDHVNEAVNRVYDQGIPMKLSFPGDSIRALGRGEQ